MSGFLSYAEQHAIGVILIAAVAASVLLWAVYEAVEAWAHRHVPTDVVEVHRRARTSGLMEVQR